jgi:hypothetical protein
MEELLKATFSAQSMLRLYDSFPAAMKSSHGSRIDSGSWKLAVEAQ